MSDLVVRIEADVPASTAERFTQDAQLIHRVFQSTREELEIPNYAVTVVLADGFEEALHRYRCGAVPTEINVEKVGGVVGKNLWQKDDFSDDVIVIDARMWRAPEDAENRYRIQELSLLTHEIAHPLVERARWAGGASARLEALGAQPSELARGVAYGIAGEYHADRMSQIAMSVLLSVTQGTETIPFNKWPYIEPWARADLEKVLTRAHSTWPQLVQSQPRKAVPCGLSRPACEGRVGQACGRPVEGYGQLLS